MTRTWTLGRLSLAAALAGTTALALGTGTASAQRRAAPSNYPPGCPPGLPPGQIVPGTPSMPLTPLPQMVPSPQGMPAPQQPSTAQPQQPTTQPQTPQEPGTQPQQPSAQPQTPQQPDAQAQAPSQEPAFGAGSGLSAGSGAVAVTMKGDQLGVPALAFGRRQRFSVAGEARSAVLVPSVRSFKIAENESPQPQDRLYLSFNYFDDVNKAVNLRGNIDARNIRVYREAIGFEKTLLDGDVSIGFRLPLNTVSADSTIAARDGSSTATGNLSLNLKAALYRAEEGNSIFSVGFAVTPPTGPDDFAGSQVVQQFNSTLLHPYLGYLWQQGNFFIHGFSAIDIPTISQDVTYILNDIGFGYYYQLPDADARLLKSIVPTVEFHLTNPLNHRGVLRNTDLAGSPDVLNITAATTLVMGGNSSLALGFVTPVTGPRPFDWEVLAQFNWRFGRSRDNSRVTAAGN